MLIAFLVVPISLWGQTRLDAVVETKRFHQPGHGERVDVNVAILGNTVLWTMDERGFQHAMVDALTLVLQGDSIVDFRKDRIYSPERADTLQGDFTYQTRFLLAPGEYELALELHDANLADTAGTYVQLPLVIPTREDRVSFSDIMFTIPGTQQGEIAPFPGTYFPQENDKLAVYAEAYGTLDHLGDGFLMVTQIENYETGQVAGNFRHVRRMKADSVVPIALEFGIGKLPSGNYLMALELHDRHDSTVQRRTLFFQRNNPMVFDPGELMDGQLGPNFTDAITDADTLAEYIRCLRPIADDLERKMIDDRATDARPDLMRQLMYTFWYNRDPADPKGAWERYKEAVDYAERKFGCRNMHGYQSDQGYIYLRYGAPNTVLDRSNETGAVPYMIWHYYRAGKYSDRRFVFYQPERATTCWTLLTSDMPGELSNSRWLDMLAPGYSDGGIKRDEVLDNYNNPR